MFVTYSITILNFNITPAFSTMRTIVLSLTILFSLGLSAFAQTIEFEYDSHEFGTLAEGDTVEHTFTFTNNGTADLILLDVKVSCGCTTPFWPKDPIAPGESSTIVAQFNTEGKGGKFNKPLTITSNATNEPVKRIFIKGTVTPREE